MTKSKGKQGHEARKAKTGKAKSKVPKYLAETGSGEDKTFLDKAKPRK